MDVLEAGLIEAREGPAPGYPLAAPVSIPVGPSASAVQPTVYRPAGVNWTAVAMIVAAHGAAIAALIQLDVIDVSPPKREPLVVEMLALPQEPPPAAVQPEPEIAPAQDIRPAVVAPPPLVRMSVPSPAPVATMAAPPPVAAAIVPAAPAPAASPAPAAPAGPVDAGDLGARVIHAPSPTYPRESRIKRETGTVVLSVLLGTGGSVEDISVQRSSGHRRLDQAALRAVRQWRWSPTVRGGERVKVRGIVEIPFRLEG